MEGPYSFLNDKLAIGRLKREYKEHGNLIIGFDFDNTIYDYHDEGLELKPVIDLLKRCSDLGFTMCLYTATLEQSSENHKKQLQEKVGYCKYGLNINVDYVNDSSVNEKEAHYDIKPFFSILLDDRTGLASAYNILKTTLDELEL